MSALVSKSSAVGAGFRRLAVITTGITFLLIFVGGLVRVSDSGLGCGPAGSGLEGWPFCHGRLIPGLDTNHIIEYSHRALAGMVGVLLIALAVLAWRQYRENRAVVRLSTTALALVIFEGSLGGLTVEKNLKEELVAAHLGTSMLILATLMALVYVCGSRPPLPTPLKRVRRLALIAPAFVWTTIVAGGYMAGTQKYGTVAYETGDGAHLACGKEFPTCNGGLFPFGDSRLVDIHLLHRSLMYMAVALMLWLIVSVLRGPASGRARTLAGYAGLVLVAQVLLGALNVWLGEHRPLILGHLMLGATLWLVVVSLTLNLLYGARDSRTATD